MNSTVAMRMPKIVYWRPKPDITTFELAQALEVLMGIAMGAKFPDLGSKRTKDTKHGQ